MNNRLFAYLFSNLVTAAVALAPDAARACSFIAECKPPVRLFALPHGVPGNLIYFKLLTNDPGALTLRRKDGAVVAASVRTVGSDRVFAPEAALPAETELELEYTTVCPLNSGLTPKLASFAFKTSEPMEPESLNPGLIRTSEGLLDPEEPLRVSAFQSLFYSPGYLTGSVEHLTDHFASLDGRPRDMNQQRVTISALCDTRIEIIDSCGGVQIKLGTHEVEAWSTVVGASVQPPHVKRTVELRCACGAGASDAGVAAAPADAATVDSAAPSSPSMEATVPHARPSVSPTDDPAPSQPAPDPEASQRRKSGCSLGTWERPDGAWFLLLGWCVLALARRVRGGRRAPVRLTH